MIQSVFPLIEAEDLVVYSKCLAPSTLRNIKNEGTGIQAPGSVFLFGWFGGAGVPYRDPRRRAGSRGWGEVLKSSGDSVV